MGDTCMEKKKFLKRYQKINKRIESLEEKLSRTDTQLTTVQISKYSGNPRSAMPMTMEDIVAEKIETEERIKRLLAEKKEVRQEIISAIDTLEDHKQIKVLESFFLEGQTFIDIAEEMVYSTKQIERFYQDGIRNIKIECL